MNHALFIDNTKYIIYHAFYNVSYDFYNPNCPLHVYNFSNLCNLHLVIMKLLQ